MIYATAPLRRVVGWFEVGSIERAAPEALWDRYHELGGVDGEAFSRYFGACDLGAAIQVRNATRIDPLALDEIAEGLKPPQSYRYLDEDKAALLGIPTSIHARLA